MDMIGTSGGNGGGVVVVLETDGGTAAAAGDAPATGSPSLVRVALDTGDDRLTISFTFRSPVTPSDVVHVSRIVIAIACC